MRQWARLVDEAVGGRLTRRFVTLGPTPPLLVGLGLPPRPLAMSAAKIVRCRREHPEVVREVWHALPLLLTQPAAVFPSNRRDGSLVTALIVAVDDCPIVVPIAAGAANEPNAVLTVFAKEAGWTWVRTQIRRAIEDGLPVFRKSGFTATEPQPEAETSSSPGPIPADGTAKPNRKILSLRLPVKPSGD